jgi:hypothetical protein
VLAREDYYLSRTEMGINPVNFYDKKTISFFIPGSVICLWQKLLEGMSINCFELVSHGNRIP